MSFHKTTEDDVLTVIIWKKMNQVGMENGAENPHSLELIIFTCS